MSTLSLLDLPMSITLRFCGTGGSRQGIVGGKALRVLDDATIELSIRDAKETVKAVWSSGSYVWAGREVWVSHSYSPLDNQLMPRIAAPTKDSIEGFLAWCADQNIFLGHQFQEMDGGRPGKMKFFRLNELTTGTESDLISKYRGTQKS